MYILSKYKDYYDYLSGIYGVDPLLILDRRKFDNHECILPEKVVFYICGLWIEGYFNGKSYYYGESLKQLGKFTPRNYWRDRDQVYIKLDTLNKLEYYINTEVLIDKMKYNKIYDCPILMKGYTNEHFYKFPQLSKYELQQVYLPEVIYKMLSEWLSNKRTLQEVKPDNRTNTEKIVSKGFDIITSFRHPIK